MRDRIEVGAILQLYLTRRFSPFWRRGVERPSLKHYFLQEKSHGSTFLGVHVNPLIFSTVLAVSEISPNMK